METNPSQPNKNEERDRDQDTTAQWQPFEAGMGTEGLRPAGTASLPASQAFQAGTRRVPAGGFRANFRDTRTRSQGTDTHPEREECGGV